MKRLACLCGVLTAVALSACRDELPPLPGGISSATGTLVPVELSLTRRGSYRLDQAGVPVFYIESKTVSLHPFSGKNVVVSGTQERNFDPQDLPVLILQDIRSAGDEEKTVWKLTAFRMQFEGPASWERFDDGGRTFFRESGSPASFLEIRMQTLSGATFADAMKSMAPGGTPLMVSQQEARRTVDAATGTQTVYIDRGASALVLSLRLPDGDEDLRTAFMELLTSLTFDGVRPPKSGSGSVASGQPCGGPAGILCPSGEFCDVTDRQENIGRCVRY